MRKIIPCIGMLMIAGCGKYTAADKTPRAAPESAAPAPASSCTIRITSRTVGFPNCSGEELQNRVEGYLASNPCVDFVTGSLYFNEDGYFYTIHRSTAGKCRT